MKKKLFVVSDIHSFYTPLKKALDEKGFEETSSKLRFRDEMRQGDQLFY